MNAPAPSDLTVVVLTRDEEANLPACLASVAGLWHRLFVVDSGSTDATVELARAAGAQVVRHAFETHAKQWHWALASLPLEASWILALDADQRVTPHLAASLRDALAAPGTHRGFYVNRRQVFRGRWIRYGGYYPMPLLKVFRRDAVSLDPAERVDHHFRVAGPVGHLQGDLVEDNANERKIGDWISKHNRYARLQAEEELFLLGTGSEPGRFWGHRDERMRWLKARWRRLPLYVRPFLYFGYRYVIRLGFLDGKEGLVFHFMQGLWYRLLVDINRDELSRAARRRPTETPHG
ncbi:MAG TPA: glycosyltransferase family 2 protein [Vicinamibacterales bacterium]|nr:glycosyltransferase family 2 protein [Vicinamibacterales bacterium]